MYCVIKWNRNGPIMLDNQWNFKITVTRQESYKSLDIVTQVSNMLFVYCIQVNWSLMKEGRSCTCQAALFLWPLSSRTEGSPTTPQIWLPFDNVSLMRRGTGWFMWLMQDRCSYMFTYKLHNGHHYLLDKGSIFGNNHYHNASWKQKKKFHQLKLHVLIWYKGALSAYESIASLNIWKSHASDVVIPSTYWYMCNELIFIFQGNHFQRRVLVKDFKALHFTEFSIAGKYNIQLGILYLGFLE